METKLSAQKAALYTNFKGGMMYWDLKNNRIIMRRQRTMEMFVDNDDYNINLEVIITEHVCRHSKYRVDEVMYFSISLHNIRQFYIIHKLHC